jgi:hypothetical protein
MKINEIITALVELSNDDKYDYFDTVHAIALIFPKHLIEQLTQLVNGPVWDGDVISKADRNILFKMGIVTRVCYKGEQGYTGSKYIGYSILKAIKDKA